MNNVWRVVITYKPPEPPDMDAWVEYLEGWRRFQDMNGDPCVYPEEAIAVWGWWTGSSRRRYLSYSPASYHLQRLLDQGIEAHIEQGTIDWAPSREQVLETRMSLSDTLRAVSSGKSE